MCSFALMNANGSSIRYMPFALFTARSRSSSGILESNTSSASGGTTRIITAAIDELRVCDEVYSNAVVDLWFWRIR